MTGDTSSSLNEVLNTVKALRDPKTGCPWDLEQDHFSLKKYLEEETQEVSELLENADGNVEKLDFDELKEELGDVLLQILLHSQLASENGKFSFDDVLETLNQKLIRRHPHVFGDSDAKTVEEVKEQWKKIKREEKESK